MNYRCVALEGVFLAVAGCTMPNPQFEVMTAANTTGGGAEDSGTTSVTPTGDPETSTTRPETGGTETSTSEVETTQTVTSVAETTQTVTSTDGSTTHSDTGSASCGDGKVDPGEECDDGNPIDEDECKNTCMKAFCGDDILQLQTGEECDDGNQIEDDGCTSKCVLTFCGDGVVQANLEQCDDGNAVNEDECTNACTKPICGDGVVQVQKGEKCDAGAKNGTKAGLCFEDCSVALSPDFLKIRVLGDTTTGLIGGVAGGDAKCKSKFNDSSYRMLASDGFSRVATQTPNKGDNPNGWVLQPYRIYVNVKDELVFITGPERLLGVRNHNPVPLVNPIHGEGVQVWTGMDKEWVATASCSKWTNGTNASLGGYGLANVSQDGSFIGVDTQGCNGGPLTIYCVQVPPG